MGRMVMKMEQERSHFDQNDQGADECKLQKRDSGMQKVYQALPFVVLIGMLVFFGIWQAVSEKRAYSASERRLLAKRPVLTAQSIFDTSFMSDYEEYLTDQFPMRDQWITMKTYCGLLLGRRESGGVYIARDRSMIELHMPEEAQGETAGRNMEVLLGFLKDMREAGAEQVRVMLVPTADSIWRNKLSPFAEPLDQQAYLEYVSSLLDEHGLKECYVDVWAGLSAHAEDPVYYKTDHHWTMFGAYIGYDAYVSSFSDTGRLPDGVLPWTAYRTEAVRLDFHGTTAAKCGLYNVNDEIVLVYPPESDAEHYRVSYDGGESESDSLYERRHIAGDDPYSVYLDGNHAMTVITITREAVGENTAAEGRTGDEEGAKNMAEAGQEDHTEDVLRDTTAAQERVRSLLLIKDSYANSFVPYLTGIYDEITLIDPRHYNGSLHALMEEHHYTDVLVLYNLPNFLTETTVYQLGR